MPGGTSTTWHQPCSAVGTGTREIVVSRRMAFAGPKNALRWLAVLLVAGAAIALALLVQTVVTYRYVAGNLIQQSARRAAEERVRDIERAARLTRPQDGAAFRVVLDEIRQDNVEQVAGLAVLTADGGVVAGSPDRAGVAPRDTRRTGVLVRESRNGRAVFVGTFTCRCSLPGRTGAAAGEPRGSGRLLVELALYEDSLSAPFARLRRNAAISAGAALMLLIALALIGLRARAYVAGRQLQAEVELARSVQSNLFPAPSQLPPVDLSVECLPASQVGGDFYDVAALPDGRVSFVVGDVSGHGLSAALLMALVHGAMSNPLWGATESPAVSAARLNDLLLTKSSSSKFASLFWCAYDPARRSLSYLNAGHPPGLLLRANAASSGVERLTGGGPVLGLMPGSSFEAHAVEASPGDLLIVMSDGITEASDADGNHFSDEQLMAVVERARLLPSGDLRDAILAAVEEFTQGRPAADDRTLLVVRLW